MLSTADINKLASHRDHLSLFADNDDEFNSHSEDNQDLAPDTLRHSGHRSLGIGHTGNPPDHEHSVHRSQSVRPDTVDHWSILLNRTLLELRSELEHGSASLEPDIILMFLVHHGGITAHIVQLFPFDMLTQVNNFRLRCSGIVALEAVLALTTLSLQDFIVVPPSRSRGKMKKSHRRGNTSTSSPSYHHSSFSSFRERERKWYKFKEETH